MKLTGKRFGKWVVVQEVAERKHGQVCWLCKCDCGNEKVLVGAVLRKGKSKSCGCYREAVKRTHGMYQAPIHRVWSNMIQRWYNPKNKVYHNYGGRGIVVCDRWRTSFEAFYQDVGDVPFEGAQLDRINNDLGYLKDNVHWATSSENLNNTRRTRYITHEGKRLSVSQWARELGIPRRTIAARWDSGKPPEVALAKKQPL